MITQKDIEQDIDNAVKFWKPLLEDYQDFFYRADKEYERLQDEEAVEEISKELEEGEFIKVEK